MGDEWSHADHGHVFLFEKQQVVSKVVKCLEWQTDHHPRACLVANLQKAIDAGKTLMEVMFGSARVNLIIKIFVLGLDAEQVTVRACLKPTAVSLLGLLSERQCNA